MAALTVMIPQVWTARFLANLDKIMVFGGAVNRDYQPDASYGNAIKIHKMDGLSISDYTINTDITNPEIPTVVEQILNIDQQKYFNFYIDSIIEAQTRPNVMDEAMGRAAYAMADTVDQFIAGLHADATTKVGTTVAPVTPTTSSVYGDLTDLQKSLDKLNVPTMGRFIIMGPAGVKLLKDSGEMLSDTPTGDNVRIDGAFGRNSNVTPAGYKGRAANFDIWMSNNTFASGAVTETWYAGTRQAISFVDSLNRMEGYSPEKRFGDAVKGLYVYGAKVVQPDALAVTYTALT